MIVHVVKTVGMCEHLRPFVLDYKCATSPHNFLSDLVADHPLHAHTSFSQTDFHLYVTLKWNIENVHDKSVVE